MRHIDAFNFGLLGVYSIIAHWNVPNFTSTTFLNIADWQSSKVNEKTKPFDVEVEPIGIGEELEINV